MGSKWRAYFELLRFPAVFTAVADVMMGYLVTRGNLHPLAGFVILATISAGLYLGGMVLNDVFDADEDARVRPERPIPSGRIGRNSAIVLGWCLVAFALAIAVHFSQHSEQWRTTAVALALAACVAVYDLGAKRTIAGPLVMGGCRLLNVLLGMSLATASNSPLLRPWTPTEWTLAIGLGVYISGVTIFARHEADRSSRLSLTLGIAILLVGLVLVAAAPFLATGAVVLTLGPLRWCLMWGLLAAVIVRRCAIAWNNRLSASVQQAVRTCLRSIVVIDAAIVLGFCGPFWGCCVLVLLAPMLLLERWASTT